MPSNTDMPSTITVRSVDYGNAREARALVELLDGYARDVAGGGARLARPPHRPAHAAPGGSAGPRARCLQAHARSSFGQPQCNARVRTGRLCCLHPGPQHGAGAISAEDAGWGRACAIGGTVNHPPGDLTA